MAAEHSDVQDAPEGWTKKVAHRPGGGTPRRGDVTFVAPNGEEMKNKRQLEKYLKDHAAAAPQLADFNWSTGETPRRSERLSLRMKRSDEPSSEAMSPTSPTKRARMKKKPSADDNDNGKEGAEPVNCAKTETIAKPIGVTG